MTSNSRDVVQCINCHNFSKDKVMECIKHIDLRLKLTNCGCKERKKMGHTVL